MSDLDTKLSNYEAILYSPETLSYFLLHNKETVSCNYCYFYPEICNKTDCQYGIIQNILQRRKLFGKNHLTKDILADIIFNNATHCNFCKNKCTANNKESCIEGIKAWLNSPAKEVE